MIPFDYRIARVQKTLRWFEEDIPLLDMRVKELSAERQQSARQFAAALIDQTRAELQRLLHERLDRSQDQNPDRNNDAHELPCEPAD
ncbi:MAG: hypothetical protein WB562_14885 [Candidatus Sulfotelmatobacter sp.]